MSYTEVSGFRFFLLFLMLLLAGYIVFSQLFSSTLAGFYIWFTVLSYLITSFVKKELILLLPRIPGFRYGGNQSRWRTSLFFIAVVIFGLVYDPSIENLKTPYTLIVLVVVVAGAVGYFVHRLVSKHIVIKSSI